MSEIYLRELLRLIQACEPGRSDTAQNLMRIYSLANEIRQNSTNHYAAEYCTAIANLLRDNPCDRGDGWRLIYAVADQMKLRCL